VGRRQPAQRPTIAQNGAFLNSRMVGTLALAGDLATHTHNNNTKPTKQKNKKKKKY
jgi:hypothetical protein